MDNIIFEKIWEDGELMELKAVCLSPFITSLSKIYVTDRLLEDLVLQINKFLDRSVKEGFWANGERGDKTAECLELRFLWKDKAGHIFIEVYAELNDGGSYSKHNCCFYVETEFGALLKFSKRIESLANNDVGYSVELNPVP